MWRNGAQKSISRAAAERQQSGSRADKFLSLVGLRVSSSRMNHAKLLCDI